MNADATPSAAPRTELDRRLKLTTDQVMAMVDAGILGEDEPVEFLRGELLIMSPQSAPHAHLFSRLMRVLSRCYPEHYWITGQVPLACGEDSLPEPDILVLRDVRCHNERRHPRGDEALLVIEIAANSQRRDRFKAGIYAEAGVPEYWLIDISARRIEVHRQPLRADGRFAEVRILSPTDRLALPELDHVFTVAELLPPETPA